MDTTGTFPAELWSRFVRASRAPGQHRPRGLCRTEGCGAGAAEGPERRGLGASLEVPRPLLCTGSSGSVGLRSGVATTHERFL